MQLLKLRRLLLCLLIVSILTSSCGSFNRLGKISSQDSNPLDLESYISGVFSSAELIRINDFVELDSAESFSYIVDKSGFVSGDRDKMNSTLNWGGVARFIPEACEYENFWTDSTQKLVTSQNVKGMVVNFGTIELTADNFNKSKVLVLGQYTLVFNSSLTTNKVYRNIMNNLKICSDGVRAFDEVGSIIELGVKNAPYKNRQFFKGSNFVLRSAQDELVGLDIYVMTKYSITYYKVFLNDLKLPSRSTWSEVNEVINAPIARICELENEQCFPVNLSDITSYNPAGDSGSKIDF